MTEALLIDRLSTPIGDFFIVADAAGRLRAAGFDDGDQHMEARLRGWRNKGGAVPVPTSNPGGLTDAIRAYFAGDLAAIDALPVLAGGTPFQEAVWQALRNIPCGETWSYGALARRIGRPAAVRAVGLANGANPVAVVVPCHRVIGADGSLTGYGGGLGRKRWLLEHERAAISPELALEA